jgi:hypothetical protein
MKLSMNYIGLSDKQCVEVAETLRGKGENLSYCNPWLRVRYPRRSRKDELGHRFTGFPRHFIAAVKVSFWPYTAKPQASQM